MSVRAIASVGVFLCVAMTSFSIYLGVVEHAYSPPAIRTATLVSMHGRTSICVATQRELDTSTTTDVKRTTVESCGDIEALGK
jgi:hypothetical protein